MRKNLLANLGDTASSTADSQSRLGYAGRGASRSMMQSIEDLAENTKKLVGGETIVSLDTDLIDTSFVSDRVEDSDEDFRPLRDAIAHDGQLQPILVRPHPTLPGRFMIVFGHRRTRAARELGVPVRAVVRELEEITHIIAQGQENSRRVDLSFIEKALFARKLQGMGQSKETIKSALTVDDSLLSRMLSVVESVPPPIIEVLGAAKTVGRDRWDELKRLVEHPKKLQQALDLIRSDEFQALAGPSRFAHLYSELKKVRRSPRRASLDGKSAWSAADGSIRATFRKTGKDFSLSLTSKDASEFGDFISSSLDDLYRSYRLTKPINQGD